MTMPFSPPTDGQSLSRAPFRACYWIQVATDIMALAADRSRMVCQMANLNQPLITGTEIIYELPIYGKIVESEYKIQLTFRTTYPQVPTDGPKVQVYCNAIDMDGAGHATDSAVPTEFYLNPTMDEGVGQLGNYSRLLVNGLQAFNTVVTPWFSLKIDPTMDIYRTLLFSINITGVVNATWLSGISVIGLTAPGEGIF